MVGVVVVVDGGGGGGVGPLPHSYQAIPLGRIMHHTQMSHSIVKSSSRRSGGDVILIRRTLALSLRPSIKSLASPWP